jgi:hypothetical protein
MLTNAMAGGLLGAVYLTVLVLQLNPHIPLISPASLHWLMSIASFHGVLLSFGIWLLLLIREALSAEPMKPAWLSVRVLAWLAAGMAGAMAWMTWGNLRGFGAVLDESAADRLRAGAIATSICAALLVVTAILRYSFGRRGGRPTAALLLVVSAASILVPLGIRGVGDVTVPSVRPPANVAPARPSAQSVDPTMPAVTSPSVRLILLDGASKSFVLERVAAGQLPNFGSILDRGAVVDLATLKPTQPEPVWAAAATGKYPPKNGVRSSGLYRAHPGDVDAVNLLPDYCFAQGLITQGFITARTATAETLRARPFWDIVSDFHLSAGIVRWPLTSPARAVRGYTVSDSFEDTSSSPHRLADSRNAAPTTAAEAARTVFDASRERAWPEVKPAEIPPRAPSGGLASVRWDRSYSEVVANLQAQFTVELSAIRFTGIDTLSHMYYRYAEPASMSNLVSRSAHEEQRRYGGVLERYYGWVDDEIGRTMRSLAPGDLLLVVSGFGMEGVSLPKLLFDRALLDPEQSGTHEAAPDGFLLAYGTSVASGTYPRGSIVDLAPTVLYFMGIPIGRDMDGYARTDLFQRNFTIGKPVSFIATHER